MSDWLSPCAAHNGVHDPFGFFFFFFSTLVLTGPKYFFGWFRDLFHRQRKDEENLVCKLEYGSLPLTPRSNVINMQPYILY